MVPTGESSSAIHRQDSDHEVSSYFKNTSPFLNAAFYVWISQLVFPEQDTAYQEVRLERDTEYMFCSLFESEVSPRTTAHV